MKKSLLLILCLSILLPAVFAKSKKTKKEKLIYVSMHRTACFGRCPDYEVKVDKNGLVTYTGYMFVKDSGVYEKNIGTAAVKQVFDICTTNRADTCQDVYDNKVPDLPGLYLVLQYKTKTKKIINASFGPGFLREIGNGIDKISAVDNTWKHVPNPQPASKPKLKAKDF